MKEIIQWLQHMEQLAREVYETCAGHFAQDQQFASFLSDLANDEKYHWELLDNAERRLSETNEHLVAAITVDQSMWKQFETPLQDLKKRIRTGGIFKQEALEYIVKVESTEWNDIFLYVLNTFQEHFKEFQQIASTVEAHRKRIEKFLESFTEQLDLSYKIRKLPPIWEQRLLIVDDMKPLRILMADLLAEFGAIETAANGKEALEKVRDNFFNVITSDIYMPIMDGIEFYRKAIEIEPDISRHFIFCSGNITPDIEAFCHEHNLMLLRKPFSVQRLQQAVQKVIDEPL